MRIFLFLIATLQLNAAFAQLKPIGSWTNHLPYNEGTSGATDGNNIYVGTTSGMYSYSTIDNSITRYSKVNGLNGVNVADLKYNNHNKTLVIVYADANIDVFQDNIVHNVPFIKQSSINNKSINSIKFHNEFAFLAFDFGIVKFNTSKKEITETYIIQESNNNLRVNEILISNDTLFAATNSGLYMASLNSNLLDQSQWKEVGFKTNDFFSAIFKHENQIITVSTNGGTQGVNEFTNGSFISRSELDNASYVDYYQLNGLLYWFTTNKLSVYDTQLNQVGELAVSGNGYKEVLFNRNNYYLVNGWAPLEKYNSSGGLASQIKPNGPISKNVTSIEISEGILWTTNGGFDGAYNSSFQTIILNQLKDGNWRTFRSGNPAALKDLFDPMSVTFDPNNPSTAYIGTFGRGLIEVDEDLNFTLYDDSNSSIQQRQDVVWFWTGVPDVEFDSDGNMWVTNTYTENCLSARINGNWRRFNLAIRDTLTNGTAVTELVITESGDKWIAIPRSNQILVYRDNGTYDNPNDDRKVVLTSQEGKGNLPGISGITMEKDLSDQIWIGTSGGLVVYFNPSNVFQRGGRDAQRILIEGPENVEVLLDGANIKDIAVDGANRKWIATEGSGVYLLSEDGTETIHHFTEANSPLFSNDVLSIGIDDISGEVYFGTVEGLISFRGTATIGKEDFSEVKVFPNPIKDGYSGPIAISGLMNDSKVKITDINGNLVNELRSNGGQAVWDGKTFDNRNVSTGVYLIFNSGLTEEESLKTHIGKIMIIR